MYRIGSVCEYYANWAAASSASWGCRLRWNALRLRVWRGYEYRMRSVCEPGGVCVQNRACLRVLRELGGGLVGLVGLSFVMECTPEVPWV